MRRARGRAALALLVAVLVAVPGAPVPFDRGDGAVEARSAAPERTAPPAPEGGWPDWPEPRAGAFPTFELAASGPDPAPGDAVIAPPPEVFDAPPAPAEAPPESLRTPPDAAVVPQGGVWAVIIGINDYPGTRYDLRSAVNDANDLDLALGRLGVGPERRMVLRDRQATAGVIRSAVDWLVAHAGPDATAVFFFAGHVRKLTSSTEAMVGADGALVTDRELADRLAPLAAERAWIVIAACYGGGFDEVLAPGRVLTAAAGPRSLAYENSAYGRSYLGEYLVRRGLLEGHATPTAQDAYSYASRELARAHPDRMLYQLDHSGGAIPLTAEERAGEHPAPPSGPAPTPAAGTGDGAADGSPSDDDGTRACAVRVGVLATACRRS